MQNRREKSGGKALKTALKISRVDARGVLLQAIALKVCG